MEERDTLFQEKHQASKKKVEAASKDIVPIPTPSKSPIHKMLDKQRMSAY